MAFELRDSEKIEKHYEDELNKSIEWLKKHLKNPKPLQDKEHFRAISWFHPRAKEPIKRVRKIKAILEEYGYIIDVIKTKDPGIIIYEDGWQVVAKPRKNT